MNEYSTISKLVFLIESGEIMPRPPSFDQKQVLESAMQVFWRKGYATTSVKDLTDVTKLQPGSLYGAFKNKRNLFMHSLDYYYENLYKDVEQILKSEMPPLCRIRHFFDHFLNIAKENNESKSCLLVNTLIELSPEDAEIKQRVSAMFKQIEKLFVETLHEAKKDGDLENGLIPETIAKMLMSGIFGIQVYNKMQNDKDDLKQIVNNLLTIIEKS